MARVRAKKIKDRVPTPDDIWRLFEKIGIETEKRAAEAEKRDQKFHRWAQEADKRAEKRAAEAEKQAEKRAAEAEKRDQKRAAEAEKRDQKFHRWAQEADKRADKRAAEAEKRDQKFHRWAQEADKRAEKRTAEAQKWAAEARKQSEKEWKTLREAQERTRKNVEELVEDGKRIHKAVNRASGHFDQQWGRFMEALVETGLANSLKERKIAVWRTQPRLKFIDPDDYDRRGEFDIVAYNGQEIVPTETKTTLRIKHIKYFVKNLRDFKKFFPEHKDKIVYGAVAYMTAVKEAEQYAVDQGLFIIQAPRAKASMAKIQNSRSFKPKTF